MNDLATLDGEQLSELVSQLPAQKRAAFSKAAKAACQHLRDSKKNYAKAYELASAMVENWWRLGIELPRLGIKPGKPKKNGPQGDNILLRDLGINRNQSQRCQKLAEMSAEELHEWLESKYDEDAYYLPTLRPAAELSGRQAANSGETEWYTPSSYVEAARKVMGSIDTDPASCDEAQKVISADVYYTKADDGLTKEWTGNVWLNPPYSQPLIQQFIEKLCAEGNQWQQAVLLTNNSTETEWFQMALNKSSIVCFPSKRISFINSDGAEMNQPNHGQAFFYYGGRVRKFVKVFGELGICCEVL